MFSSVEGKSGFSDGGFGGGFSNNGGFSNDSQGGSGDRQKKSRVLNIAPVTTKSIKDMTFDDTSFKYNGVDVNQITVVGSIVHHEQSQMCHTYQLDDTSGPVTVKHWISNDDGDDNNMAEQQLFEVGTYVRVFAQLRSFQKTITLNVLQMRAVTDLNEITTHILECMKYKKMMSRSTTSSHTNGTNGFNGNHSSAISSSGPSNGFDTIQNQVWKLVSTTDKPEGMGITEIQATLKGLSSTQIRKALDFLSNEGHIYSTINDEHYRSTS